MGENLVEAMQPELREKYMELQNINATLLQRLDVMQNEINSLETRKQQLQDELSMSKVKWWQYLNYNLLPSSKLCFFREVLGAEGSSDSCTY